MPEKMMRVRGCEDCKYGRRGDVLHEYVCHLCCRELGEQLTDTAPDWCPLEDAPCWVPASSGELPTEGVPVPATTNGRTWERVTYWPTLSVWQDQWGMFMRITHWLKGLPAMPREGSNG